MNYPTLGNVFSVRQDMLTMSLLSPSVTKFCANTSFRLASMSILSDCKVDGIFRAKTPLKPFAPLGKEEPISWLWMSGYLLVKNQKSFLKSHHNSIDQKKKKKNQERKNLEDLKERWRVERKTKVMSNNLHLHNIFHQSSSLPYRGCIS